MVDIKEGRKKKRYFRIIRLRICRMGREYLIIVGVVVA